MISVRVGPLHAAEAEAILRPVSSDFDPVSGAGRDVEVRSGAGIQDRLVALGGLPVGGAVVTPGGDLAVPFLIHVVVQSTEEPVSEAGVRNALVNGLRRAAEWGIETLALPPLGTGPGNLEPETAARIMLAVLREHLEREEHPRDVTVTVPNDYEEEVFRGALRRAERGPGPAGRSAAPDGESGTEGEERAAPDEESAPEVQR